MDELAQINEKEKFVWPARPGDHEDGIYFGMPEEEYHRDSAIGASGIVDLRISPLAYWKNSVWNPKREEAEETDATIRGTYFHEALAAGKSTVVVKPAGMSFATKEGKDFKESHPGATFIKAEDTEKAQEMIDAMRETGVLERVGGIGGGISEVSFFWTDKAGRRRKMRADRIFEGELFDWKTMANTMPKDIETLLAHTVAQHRYHIKAFWYQVGIQAMKQMIGSVGPKAFKSEMNDLRYEQMKGLLDTETIVPFWYVFIENSGVPNIEMRRFVSHDDSGQLNAYFRAAKQETEEALKTWDRYMREKGPDKPWYRPVYPKAFADEDFMAARWILAEE